MANLKDLLMDIAEDDVHYDDDAVEVYADSVQQALDMAAAEFGVDVTMLDYDIVRKGTRGVFGFGRQPFVVLVRPIRSDAEHDFDAMEEKLAMAVEHVPGVKIQDRKDADSTYRIRVTRTGIWLTITPPRGKGKPVDIGEIMSRLNSMRIARYNNARLEQEIKKPSGERVKLGDWTPNPEYDGTMSIEVTEDEMRAYVHFVPPRFSGRHMETDEVLQSLKNAGVVSGLNEKRIVEYLENMDYTQPLLAAEGVRPRNGRDAYVDYKVRIDKSGVKFEEDESGKVDFRNLELLENVVVGQLLAQKVPAEEGMPGRTVTNRILPAKSGKDMSIQHGKGTILSEDGTELTAEINGQVVYKLGRLSIEPVYVVNGDVSLETGNIVFLGSVIVMGSVQDNFVVKAAGNIEIKGTVQKAFLESEGDIIVHQGISGRDEAKIESTGGSIFAKFIQRANVFGEGDVVVPEGILQSNVDAGGRIYCVGRRARIIGGRIRAGNEVNARYLGGDASTKTEIRVGIHPKVLQQLSELTDMKEKLEAELADVQKNLKTLSTQKKSGMKFTEEREKLYEDLNGRDQKLSTRLEEITLELEELNSYINMLEHKGKICAEKTAYPGVDVYIKDQKFQLKDEYNYIKFSLQGKEIRLSEYEPPEIAEGQQRITTLVRSRKR